MGKTPIKVKESAGFLVNRILLPYLNEAATIFAEGEDIKRIDKILLDFGMPMGPLALIDKVGVDIGEKVSYILHRAYGERMAPGTLLTKMVEHGWLGQKSGMGFYNHKSKGSEINKELLKLQTDHVKLDKKTIKNRALLIMINEAARCLEEDVVDNPGYLDMAMIMGTGFPPFRGGLMRYADAIGIDQIIADLKQLQKNHGNRFAPCDHLLGMAEKNESFYGGTL